MSHRPPGGYSTAEFRKGMSAAFEAARYEDAIVDVHRHGKKWVSIISPVRAELLNKIESVGRLEKSEVTAALPKLTRSFEVGELLEALNSLRERSDADREHGEV